MKLKQISLFLVLLALLGTMAFPLVTHNRSCDIFLPNACQTSGTSGNGDNTGNTIQVIPESKKSQVTMEIAIANGGTYFLKSYSDYLLLLSKVETDLKDGSIADVLETSISNLEQAREMYGELINIAEGKAYNPSVVESLYRFNYNRYLKRKGLNRQIFNEVREFLVNADIIGLYKKYYIGIEEILGELKALDPNNISISRLWGIMQKFTHIHLLGQYTAQVFVEISWGNNG